MFCVCGAAGAANEGVLANFFNSLLSKKTGAPGSPGSGAVGAGVQGSAKKPGTTSYFSALTCDLNKNNNLPIVKASLLWFRSFPFNKTLLLTSCASIAISDRGPQRISRSKQSEELDRGPIIGRGCEPFLSFLSTA